MDGLEVPSLPSRVDEADEFALFVAGVVNIPDQLEDRDLLLDLGASTLALGLGRETLIVGLNEVEGPHHVGVGSLEPRCLGSGVSDGTYLDRHPTSTHGRAKRPVLLI